MVQRLSTNQLVNILTDQIARGQDKLFKLSNKLSSGKNFTNAYEAPLEAAKALVIRGDIEANKQRLANNNYAKLELETADGALSSMGDLIRKAREIIVASSNGTSGATERKMQAQEIRQLGELLVSLTNTKAAGKYIFSGIQGNVPTLKLASGASFTAATYRGGEGDLGERSYDGNQSSVSLRNLLISSASTAEVTGSIVNPTIEEDGDLTFTVNDGTGRITTATASLSAGDSLTTVVSKINTAFSVAGGLGTVARNNPTGFLNISTNLPIGNQVGEDASITISNESDDSILNDLGLKPNVTNGGNAGLLSMFSSLESALNTNNVSSVRNLLDVVDYNLDKLTKIRGDVGSLTNKLESSESFEIELGSKLTKDLSSIEDVDVARLGQEYTNAQTTLQAAIQTTSNFFQYSLRGLSGFLGG